MRILGISAFFHDSAACIVDDGEVVAAAQEERFSRVKHDAGWPEQAIAACLDLANCTVDDLDMVAFYERPHLKFERILVNAQRCYPKGREAFDVALSRWLDRKLWTPGLIRERIASLSPSDGRTMRWDGRVMFTRHHHAHAASAFYPSPFESAAILVVDGVGEWATTSMSVGTLDARGVPRIEFLKEIRYPHSLGLLYSAFTRYLGFEVNEGEYKMMGLAPYGTPRFVEVLRDQVIEVHDDSSFSLNLDLFAFPHSREMFDDSLCQLFGLPMRDPDEPLLDTHMDIAASVQVVTQDVMLGLARHLHDLTGQTNLCLAGGVALNCVANGLIQQAGPYRDVWVQPAAGDAGGALGAALVGWHEVRKERRPRRAHGAADGMNGALLGPAFDDDQCRQALEQAGLHYDEVTVDDLPEHVADLLAQGQIVGWFQGRMEFGPRALGSRSILADPRPATMQKQLNLRVKFRESFRPLAPSVLRDRAHEWFELNGRDGALLGTPDGGYDSPYMLLVAQVAEDKRVPVPPDEPAGIARIDVARSLIPSCTHVDGSARMQTVARDDNPLYYDLISAFERRTGVPVLVNTSFNVRGEPIVCTPDDAVKCFLHTEIDVLVMGGLIAAKSVQDDHHRQAVIRAPERVARESVDLFD